MLSNGLHGQRYHSLTVFVPTIKCPHYCQLAHHLYPDANRSTCGAARGAEKAVWSSVRAVWSAERERELSGAQKAPSRGQGVPLPRAVYHGLFTAGVQFGLVRAGWLGHAVYGWLVTPCGDGGLVRVCCLWRVGYDWWLGWAVYGGLVTADVCVVLGCRDGTYDLA